MTDRREQQRPNEAPRAAQEVPQMTQPNDSSLITRRRLLGVGGAGVLTIATGGTIAALARRGEPAIAAGAARARAAQAAPFAGTKLRLVASDGYISLPGRAEPLFVMGFNAAELDHSTRRVIRDHKGKIKWPAPIIGVDEDVELMITLTNAGFQTRPDLADSHTIHWHGFRNPAALFDGVPEVAVAVPVRRSFPYYYKPSDAGTYMYHCHFEDVEHVQMGMTGIVFVRPVQNRGTATLPAGKYAYNDGDGSTAYDREVTLLLNEVDPAPHDLLEAVQEYAWYKYSPKFWVINGRAFPDTIMPTDDPSLPSQPTSSLIQANGGDRVLLRFASLGYQQHAMQLPGIRMKVVGEDATHLRGPGGADLSYETHSIYIGPGESRDVLFTAPAFGDGAVAGTHPTYGRFNTYQLKNRSHNKLVNDTAAGLGGMVTEVRIYENPLPAQTAPNETF